MEEPKLTFDDPREIYYISYPGEDGAMTKVGSNGVTKIVAYRENGEMASILYFAIYHGEELRSRVNGKYVEQVTYLS